MWGWLDGIIDKLTGIAQSIIQIPINIVNGIKEFFTELLVPNTEELELIFEDVKNSVSSIIGIDNFDFDNIWGTATAPSDVKGSVDFGLFKYNGKFADMSFLKQGVEYFRPYIRGFIVLLLCLYNVRQALSMFGLSSGEIKSAAEGDGK